MAASPIAVIMPAGQVEPSDAVQIEGVIYAVKLRARNPALRTVTMTLVSLETNEQFIVTLPLNKGIIKRGIVEWN